MDVFRDEVIDGIVTGILLAYSLFIYTYLMVLAFKNQKANHSFFVGMLVLFIVHFIGIGPALLISTEFNLPMGLLMFFVVFGIFSLVAFFFMAIFTVIRYLIEKV